MDVLKLRVGVERHGFVLKGIIIQPGAVVGIDGRAARAGGAVGGTGGELHVLLITFPGDARRVQLAREVRRIEYIIIRRARIVVRVNPEIRPALDPDVVRLGWMHADPGVGILCGLFVPRNIWMVTRWVRVTLDWK